MTLPITKLTVLPAPVALPVFLVKRKRHCDFKKLQFESPLTFVNVAFEAAKPGRPVIVEVPVSHEAPMRGESPQNSMIMLWALEGVVNETK